jgi:hypothetical protein
MWFTVLALALFARPIAIDAAAAAADVSEVREITLPGAVQRDLAEADLPVLVPDVAGLDERVTLTRGPGWYAIAMHGDGLHVTVHGLAVAKDHPDLRPEQAAAGFGDGTVRVARMHMIWSASFERYGVGYTVDLECARPGADARCADDRAVRALVGALVTAGAPR